MSAGSVAPTVHKYGGSSLRDLAALRRVAASIAEAQRAGLRLVVVVSAMGKTTEELIATARGLTAVPPRRELDMLVTAGERIAMALLCMAIDAAGGQAISFTGSQSGIITESSHQGAKILEVRPARIEAALDEGKAVIVAGYQGVSLAREVTTLGRGGSDTTAVALAAALGAESCEIFSDVDGVYTADPNVCPQARLLAEVPYAVMHAMAGAGARVLAADAVAFAQKAGITIVARKTGDTSGRMTRVTGAPRAGPPRAGAVVGATHAALVHGNAVQLPWSVWQAAQKFGARPVALGAHGGLLDLSGVAGQDAQALAEAVTAHDATVQVTPVATATLVGHDLLGGVADLCAGLAASCPDALAHFSSDLSVTVALPRASLPARINALHERFVRA